MSFYRAGSPSSVYPLSAGGAKSVRSSRHQLPTLRFETTAFHDSTFVACWSYMVPMELHPALLA